jgi:hypothetical protein
MNATNQRTDIMKKTLIAFAALATLATGMAASTTAAQAKIKVDLHLGGGFYDPGYYEPSYYDEPDCYYAKVKKVKWINGYKHVFWKNKLVCY